MSDLVLPARYGRRLSPSDFLHAVDDVEASLRDLRANGPQLLERTRTSKRTLTSDGWARSVRPKVGGSGGTNTSPVEAAVIADEAEDPLWALASEMCAAVKACSDLLRAANGAWQKSIPSNKPCWKCESSRAVDDEWCRSCGSPPAPPAGGNCINHDRFGLHATAWKASRCQPCYRYRAKHDRDAPEEVLRDLEDMRIERELRRAA